MMNQEDYNFILRFYGTNSKTRKAVIKENTTSSNIFFTKYLINPIN